jgi:hypothetical protein
LNQDAGAITGFGVAAASAAMGKIEEHLDPLANDFRAADSANAGDEANAACVVLVGRGIQALRDGKPIFFRHLRHF